MGTFDLTPWLKIPLIKDEDINSKTLVRSKITKKLIYLTLLFRGEPITFHHKKTDELEKLIRSIRLEQKMLKKLKSVFS